MLVLSRKINEGILIDNQIRVTVLSIRGNQVRIGIEAPGHIRVIREELTRADRPNTAMAPHNYATVNETTLEPHPVVSEIAPR